MGSSEIRIETVHSDVLRGNALGDPVDRRVFVYLPPDHRPGTQRYPVVFLLAGFGGSGASFLGYEPWEESIQQTMDRLLVDGVVRPMILVLPDGMTRFGGSQYINSSGTGRYQDYLIELVDWVDQTFPTLAARESRAIGGKSSGGFGALRMAMDHPEVFALVADHSGDKYFDYAYRPTLPKLQATLEGAGDLASILRDPTAHRPHDQAFRDIMEAAALSACYSPNDASPFGFDFPIDLETGALRDDVWERWLGHDPLLRLEAHAEALRRLRLIYLDCGRRDEFYLHVGMRLFHLGLERLGIDHRYTEHAEGHFQLSYRYAFSLEAISRAVA